MTLRIISSASVRRSEEEEGSPDIGAERIEHQGHRPPCKEVSVSSDFDLASGQVRLISFETRWTLVSCATLASVLFCRFQPRHHST